MMLLGVSSYLISKERNRTDAQCLGWFSSSKKEPEKKVPVEKKRDELAGRCKGIQYAANFPN